MLAHFQIFVSVPMFGVNICFWYLWCPADSVCVYYTGMPPATLFINIIVYSNEATTKLWLTYCSCTLNQWQSSKGKGQYSHYDSLAWRLFG